MKLKLVIAILLLSIQARTAEVPRDITAASPRPAKDAKVPMLSDTIATGTGTIVTESGYVLTAYHLVQGVKRISVITAAADKRTAVVVRIDKTNDLAILKIEGTKMNYPCLPIGPSGEVRLGQSVATIGFPNIEIQGLSPKVTKGEISSLKGIGDDPRCWQISVPIQPGNSGGPLLDEGGNLIGIVVAKLGLKAAAVIGDLPQNVSYAVKGDVAWALFPKRMTGYTADSKYEDIVVRGIIDPPKLSFVDMVEHAKKSVVLIIVE